ncbi:MAG: uroporphyrinogen-III decarboxylase-like protein [Planctomycetes bacterium]|nr:uroporphyrinogen-III decarboxylase-like protein [Planctomycetota bacterium]
MQGAYGMDRRQTVIDALEFRRPAYVPWQWSPTQTCAERLRSYLGVGDLSGFLGDHFCICGASIGRFEPVDDDHVRDVYGVVWDRSVDKDIGVPADWPIREPQDLDRYRWPDAADSAWYADIPAALARRGDRFTVYALGFSLYERAWTMRGMVELLGDMIGRPEFVERLLDVITDHNLVQIHKALAFDFDAVYFGDDYGMQTGLIMGLDRWRRFIKPRLARMFAPVREAGKFIILHSCGRVDQLFDDLVEIGLNCFNPFQPEVMDTLALKRRYHGRLAFHGGLSVQQVLPFGTVNEVRRAAQTLLDAGREGGLIFAPSHAAPADVPPENLVAMMEVLRGQPGAPA